MNNSFRNLIVYKKGFDLAMDIFTISKKFPREELFSLTDQIRRSSRSVCSSIAEAYRKRNYEGYFISKTSDADMENSETQVWLDFALRCQYINSTEYTDLLCKSEEVGKLLNHMLEHPAKYLTIKNKLN